MTPWQMFTSNFKAQRMNLHPFGEPGFVLIEKQSRDGKLGDVRERALCLCNGHFNCLHNKFSDMPNANIMIYCSKGNIKTTDKAIFPYLTSNLQDIGEDPVQPLQEQDAGHASPVSHWRHERSSPTFDAVATEIQYDPSAQAGIPQDDTPESRPTMVPKPPQLVMDTESAPTTTTRSPANIPTLPSPQTIKKGEPYHIWKQRQDQLALDSDTHRLAQKANECIYPDQDRASDDPMPDRNSRPTRHRRKPPRYSIGHGADSKWSDDPNAQSQLNYLNSFVLTLPSLYELYINEEPIHFPNRDHKFSLDKRRFRHYNVATDVPMFFRLGGTIRDFRNDLNKGKFVFDNVNEHLQDTCTPYMSQG